jgi:phage baseplate assembly protein V
MINSVIGIVKERDPTTYRIRATLPEYDGMVSPWCNVLAAKTALDKHAALPDIGEQVVILLELDLNRGFVIGAVYSDVDTVPTTDGDTTIKKFSDGAYVAYNRKTHTMTVLTSGTINVTASTINIAATSTHNGNITVNGDVSINGNISTSGNASVGGNASVSGAISAAGGISGSGGLSFEGHTHTDSRGGGTSTPH